MYAYTKNERNTVTSVGFYGSQRTKSLSPLRSISVLNQAYIKFDFVVNSLLMELFRTNTVEIVKCCQYYLGFKLSTVMLDKRTDNFEEKYINKCTFCKYLL